MPFRRVFLPLLVALAVLGVARADEYVIVPGAESLLADMLGAGQTLPGGCTLTDGRIERTTVVATYGCGSGEVALELGHPGAARSGAVRTERFAIGVARGTPPAGLVDAVAARIRAREGAFEWTKVGGAPAAARLRPALIAGSALVVVVLVFWFLRRRRPGSA